MLVDRNFWFREDSYQEGWAVRAELASRWLPKAGSVLDVGCGARMDLRRFLHADVRYVGADMKAWTKDIHYVDLDCGVFPLGAFDAIVILGVLEYLRKPSFALQQARRCTGLIVMSYCHPVESGAMDHRRSRGWVNAFSEPEFESLIGRRRWSIKDQTTISNNNNTKQVLYRCRAA